MRCRPEIVVGLNHSPAAREALRWAVGEANRLRADVTVVHAVDVTERADLAMERDIAAEARQCSGRVLQWTAESVTAMPPNGRTRFVTPVTSVIGALTAGGTRRTACGGGTIAGPSLGKVARETRAPRRVFGVLR